MIAGDRFAKLLQSPGCRCMCDDLAMREAPCTDLHQEEYMESSQPTSLSDGSRMEFLHTTRTDQLKNFGSNHTDFV